MTVILGYATPALLVIGSDGISVAGGSEIVTLDAVKLHRLTRRDGEPFGLLGVGGTGLVSDRLVTLDHYAGCLAPSTLLAGELREVGHDDDLADAHVTACWLTEIADQVHAVDKGGFWDGCAILVLPSGVYYLSHNSATYYGQYGTVGSGDSWAAGYIAGRLAANTLDGLGASDGDDHVAMVMDAIDYTITKVTNVAGRVAILTMPTPT